jgi:CTD small phosphatase-like protein 2
MIQHRLYRHHISVNRDNTWIKDLSLLGRDLSKVIMIDDLQKNFQKQPDNGIQIKAFTGDGEDTALLELCPVLKGTRASAEIYDYQVEDVRVALRFFREKMIENRENGVKNPHMNISFSTTRTKTN